MSNNSILEDDNQEFTIISKVNINTIICIFLIYGNLDFLFSRANEIGNMAYAGIYLGLIQLRNIIYVFFTVLCISYYLNMNRKIIYFVLVLLIISIVKFINLINKYKQFLI